MNKQIVVGLDVFSHIWSNRLPHESNEDQILSRLLNIRMYAPTISLDEQKTVVQSKLVSTSASEIPKSRRWIDILIWTLQQHGGRATLAEIYETSREGRLLVGMPITIQHDASARECLESHCSDSHKYRARMDLFYMPEGKGAGVWALR